jgi:hypothetical protein
LQATGGIFEALYQGSIPGRETSHIVEHLFSRLNATSSYRNCQIFEAKGEAVGGCMAIRLMPVRKILETRLHGRTGFIWCDPSWNFHRRPVATTLAPWVFIPTNEAEAMGVS